MNQYESYIHKSRYARWVPKESRRETWEETVDRYMSLWTDKLSKTAISELRNAILNREVMPSMRCLMTAGPALVRDNAAGFNCAYVGVDHPRVFDEILYVLMCGTGVGFSVERQFISKLPEVAEEFHDTDSTVKVADSKIGWAKAFRELVSLLYVGQVPQWDTSSVRPSGARLVTFGGRASGPEPLEQLFLFTVEAFKGAAGRQLNSIECHDIVCKVAESVIVGGVRRSALISLSNLTDDRMRRAKSGNWQDTEPQRRLANNSACYTEKPDFDSFLKEAISLHESKSGERGIFSRVASEKQACASGRREGGFQWGTNPCSEIILRSCQFCNLTEVVIRPEDTLEDLKRKVRQATILGTLQSSLTDFRYLRPIWKKNTKEEALLGVSLTGIMDHPVMSGKSIEDTGVCYEFCKNEDIELPEILSTLKEVAVSTNKLWATKIGVNQSAAITCVKPSGTVSQLVGSASGIHPRYSDFYIRRIRTDSKDPLGKALQGQGFPCEVDVYSKTDLVFSFPQKAPAESIKEGDLAGIQMLELWKVYQDYWCEHKPSCTIHYKEDEFLGIMQWVWTHFDEISGVSFLPYSGHVYAQAPYEQITELEYVLLNSELPEINWKELEDFEKEDLTTASQELACGGADTCEL